MQTTVTIDSTSQTFTHARGAWTGTFPISEIPTWLAFYLAQQERYPAHAATYEADVQQLSAALLTLQKKDVAL